MPVVTRKSGLITSRDASPKALTTAALAAGLRKGFTATLETVNTDSVGSVYLLGSIPSNAYGVSIELWADDIGTTTAANFGLYRTTADGGALVNATLFAAAVVLNAAVVSGTRIEHQSGVYDTAEVEQPLWQILGLTADPQTMYDLAATLTGAADAAGTITVKVTYSV